MKGSVARHLRLAAMFLACTVQAQGSGAPVVAAVQNDRLYRQEAGRLTVTTAVPSAAETRDIFGANLYARGVQPVWVEVRNDGDTQVLLTPMGVDRGYFTARETAYRGAGGEPLALLARDYEQRSISRLPVAPRSTRTGYIFTRVDEGTKSFNVDVTGDGKPYRFTFFVPVPGLRLDHYEVDFKALYAGTARRDLSLEQLVGEVENMPCCVRDAAGEDEGDPLNLVLIGETLDLYYGFLRAGWDETETINRDSLWKTAKSALGGGRYRYSPVSALYVFDRPQDVALQRARGSIHLRNHLRLWLTPLTLEGAPVWIGQISRDIGVRFTRRTITTHKIDPDVDETRDFLLEDLAYAEAVEKFGYVGGVGAAMWISGRSHSIAELKPVALSAPRAGEP